MSSLHDLWTLGGQSPWLDNLRRDWIQDGELQQWVDRGVRGVTSNPSIFQKAIEGQAIYDEQFGELINSGASVEEAYWGLVTTDITRALDILAPVHEASNGLDGYVSVEVAPSLARDTEGTLKAARELFSKINKPNLYIKIPGTAEGIPAIRDVLASGISVNVTLLFSVARYGEIIDAHFDALEAIDGPLDHVSSVASFFVSRVDHAVDEQLAKIGSPEAQALMGKAAVANAKLAYELFLNRYQGPRWDALKSRGAQPQRPLWASTSTKNPAYPKTLYVDSLIGPNTVNTMPEVTIAAFETEGVIGRNADRALDEAHATLDAIAALGIDLDAITTELENQGVSAFEQAFDDLLVSLGKKAEQLTSGT